MTTSPLFVCALFAGLLNLVSCTDIKVDSLSFGSVMKLEHVSSGFRLHSHELPYASGSGQQSVTGQSLQGDSNSFWIVKQAHSTTSARERSGGPRTSKPVKCGDTIRLQHLGTGRNLHSHLVSAPMNSDHEVSAYAKDSEGIWKDGDTGDDWTLQCENARNGDPWLRSAKVLFKHVDTGHFLTTSKSLVYDDPIEGQSHVSARRRRNSDCVWRAAEGFYIAPRDTTA